MTHSHTPYAALWYTPENAAQRTKVSQALSRQINIDKIAPLPRLSLVGLQEDEYGEYELELLSKAEEYGLKLSYTNPYTRKTVSFDDLEYMVLLYENLDDEGLLIAEKAHIYHIPIQESHLKNIMNLRFEIEDYELELDSADRAGIDWDTSVYDPEGLRAAVDEANWNFQQQYWDYRDSVDAAYKAGRGV